MLKDMMDRICRNDGFKKTLIFRKQGFAYNAKIFENVVKEMKVRATLEGYNHQIRGPH